MTFFNQVSIRVSPKLSYLLHLSSVLHHLHIYLDLLEENHLMVTFNNKFELILTYLQDTLYDRATFERQHGDDLPGGYPQARSNSGAPNGGDPNASQKPPIPYR